MKALLISDWKPHPSAWFSGSIRHGDVTAFLHIVFGQIEQYVYMSGSDLRLAAQVGASGR